MKKSVLWAIAAFLFVLVAGISLYSFANPSELETCKYEINENFNDITVIVDTADIQIIISENANSYVVCEEENSAKHSVVVKENMLRVEADDNSKWYENLKVNLHTPKITVYLGKSECGNISLKTDTGNVFLENVIATGKLSIDIDTGNVDFEACDASEIYIKTDTGNVTGSFLTNKVVFAESETGKIDIPKVLADEKCEIVTKTGNIKITIK